MKRLILSLTLTTCVLATAMSQQTATIRIDSQTRYQHITGFGGFVCSPQFQYNHMSSADIKKVWGAGSTVGCNIMRHYVPK
jgi:glucuronoarabinoxylan endo-1,4-beta-xylanase